jgi:tRNA threonylcarbamoyladenosine biosynthesis protein TsaE
MHETDHAAMDFDLADEAATAELAARLAGVSSQGDVLALIGDLGTGKTSFARAFVRVAGRGDEEVPSPTFTLLQTYENGPVPVFHFDLYRLKGSDEALELGIEDAFADGITLIEWPDRLGALLPADRLDVTFSQGATADARRARIRGFGYWRARVSDGLAGGIHDHV